MLTTVDVAKQPVASLEGSAGGHAVAELRRLAGPLLGLRVLHINATPYGGGVAEILRSLVPLLRDLGIECDWKVIVGEETFFNVTKAMHNGLQGADRDLSDMEKETYLTHSTRNARLLDQEEPYDLIVVHDPQPLALAELCREHASRWIWRCHIDTSEPNTAVWEFLLPYLKPYQAAVFTMAEFVPPHFPVQRVNIIPPAIDPDSPKNMEISPGLARRLLEWFGVDTGRPLMTQISRFDPWKDPLGVIEAFRKARSEVPSLQLCLVGSMALDDPEGWGIYREIQEAAREDPAIYTFTNLTGVGNTEVNAFQRLSDVIVQKSIREGFGLVVSEALWKGTPVVAGRAGGIPMQLEEGVSGFLVESVEECADRVVGLLRDRDRARRMGLHGREHVRERFLITRLLADELRLYASVLGEDSRS